MKLNSRTLTLATALLAIAFGAVAQDDGGVRRRSGSERTRPGQQSTQGPELTDRVKNLFDTDANSSVSDADVQWIRVIYRQIDLDKDKNAALYFPEEPIEGQENLFRIIMRLMANNQLTAYEYLDGREVFTDQYKVNVRDMLDRFHILYTPAKGSTEKNPRFAIDESDVPSNEVLSYYLIERWQYDTRHNRLRPHIEAICPVLHRTGDFGGEAVRYPMFWIRFNDIRPWLSQQAIFVDDNNNMPSCTYDDFFTMSMYDGEIYKTRNLKNRSMMQLYPNEDKRKLAQDSIQASLDSFEKKLWVPSREEVIAAREAREAAERGDTANVDSSDGDNKSARAARSTRRSGKKPAARQTKVKQSKPKAVKASSSSNAARSVRRRK
ncbi:MAG: gliding motility protein GldN [Muribaculaceae bacterium]|nr:gliding motility protein GldN [Muribaculaceae bacterium]